MSTIISTNEAPAAIGPYSQAVVHNGVIYVSGQIPLDPKTGELCTGSMTEQTTLVMNNIAAILKSAGSGLSKVIKCTLLVADLSRFDEINEAYGKFFPENPPARACYQVAALPRNAGIEIEVICEE
jgi:2-iminobutanoate/2-iminopropanoate deaminase